MKKTLIVALILITLTLTACGGSNRSSVVVAGSTSVQPYVEFLVEEYERIYPDTHIEVQGGGSAVGKNAVETGVADIGMMSRALKENEQHLHSIEIARDGLAIIVHPLNPITNLTREQIRQIYSAEITNWSEVGGLDRQIHVMAREEGSGTRGQFTDLVMDKTRITPKAIVQNSNGAIRQLVAYDRDSIGFISLGLVDSTVKAVAIDGVPASYDNVRNETYSLFRPFLFLVNEPDEATNHFIEFVLSPKGKELLTSEGLIP